MPCPGYCSSELNFTWTVTSELNFTWIVTSELRMHAKAGNKRQLTWPFFSVLHCLRSSGVLLCCLPLSPFFSLFSSLLFPFFSVLLSFSRKLALRRTKTIGAEASALSQWLLLLGTAKAMAMLVLVFVCFLSFCWCFLSRWRRWWQWRRVVLVELAPLPLCFPCFRQCRSYGFLCPASLSFLLVFLFLFFSVLSAFFFFSFFVPPLLPVEEAYIT